MVVLLYRMPFDLADMCMHATVPGSSSVLFSSRTERTYSLQRQWVKTPRLVVTRLTI